MIPGSDVNLVSYCNVVFPKVFRPRRNKSSMTIDRPIEPAFVKSQIDVNPALNFPSKLYVVLNLEKPKRGTNFPNYRVVRNVPPPLPTFSLNILTGLKCK